MTVTALASAPSRANTSITLSWGLLTIPLSVYSGVESTRVARKEFYAPGDVPTDVEVGRCATRKDNGEIVDTADVVRMAQATNGNWAVLTDDEIALCTSPRGMAEIVAFVPNKSVGTYLVEDVKQVRPQKVKGKANPANEKAFALLLAAMAKRKVQALVKVAMRGPARYCLLDTDGNLFMVATADAVRQAIPRPKVEVTDAELALALSLIDAVGVDAPVLTDETAIKVQVFVDGKANGVVATPAPAITVSADDLMAQLMASVDATKAAKVSA